MDIDKDLDKLDDEYLGTWLVRIRLIVELAGKLVANVGFPILVATGLLVVLYRTVPVLSSLDSTMKQVATQLQISNDKAQEIDNLLTVEKEKIDEMDRKADQYHQDYMLTHRSPLPDDPPPRFVHLHNHKLQ